MKQSILDWIQQESVMQWTVIIMGSLALLLNDIVKRQLIGAFAGELTFILIFIIIPKLITKYTNKKTY